jgi:hypothetical protein
MEKQGAREDNPWPAAVPVLRYPSFLLNANTVLSRLARLVSTVGPKYSTGLVLYCVTWAKLFRAGATPYTQTQIQELRLTSDLKASRTTRS